MPEISGRSCIAITLIGKVADIVENGFGRSLPYADTEDTMRTGLSETANMIGGFITVNAQETDIASIQLVPDVLHIFVIAHKYILNRLKKVSTLRV